MLNNYKQNNRKMKTMRTLVLICIRGNAINCNKLIDMQQFNTCPLCIYTGRPNAITSLSLQCNNFESIPSEKSDNKFILIELLVGEKGFLTASRIKQPAQQWPCLLGDSGGWGYSSK